MGTAINILACFAVMALPYFVSRFVDWYEITFDKGPRL